jgi:excisionase family DNA binding protein
MIGLQCSSAIVCADPVLLFENMPTDSSQTMELLTIAGVAEFLKISKSTARRLQQQRLIPFFKVGGSVRFTKSDLVSYLEKQRVETIG